MQQFRKGIQYAIVGISFITFKRTHIFPLKLALFLILASIILQEFLYIFNHEIKNPETSFFKKMNPGRLLQVVIIITLELLLFGALYYLSIELWK